MELLNGCHILVSTPAALKKVLNFWPGKVTDFKRLRALVLDDADVLLYKHNEEVNFKLVLKVTIIHLHISRLVNGLLKLERKRLKARNLCRLC